MNKDFLIAINDELVAYRIQKLRRLRNWPNIPGEYIIEEEQEHLDFLCQVLPDVVIRKNQKYNLSWSVGKFCVNVLVGVTASSLFGPLAIPICGAAAPIVEQIGEEVVATATDNTALSEKTKEKLIQKIAKKRKIALTGILRDWLTKPITLKE